jgi:hypothetical protein
MRRRYDSKLAQEPVPAPSSWVMGIVKLRSWRRLINSVRVRHEPPVERGDQLPLLRGILAEAKRTVEEWGGSLHFVYLPDLPLVMGRALLRIMTACSRSPQNWGWMSSTCFPDFEKHPSPLSLFPYEEADISSGHMGLHYNADGHRLVARRVIETLQKYEQK